ncbi:MAG: DUF1080 domain-containing protein [Verrucomicrobiota bacterium]
MASSFLRTSYVLAACAFGALAQAAQPPAGFTPLYNGKDLSGWRGGTTYDHRKLLDLPEAERAALMTKWTTSMTELKDGKPHWRAEGDVLFNDGIGGYATTQKDFGDFELLLDYKIAPGADSGVYLRGVPQVQIWDTAIPDTKEIGYAKGSGGLWNNNKGAPGKDPLVKADNPVGEWNSLRVVMVGARVSVWLNKKLVVDHALLENYYDKADKKLKPEERRPIPAKGPIQLQTHGGATHWRNIFIREIGTAEANKLLASKGAEGFKPIFNGKDFTGWTIEEKAATKTVPAVKTPADVIEIKDGTLVWLDKRGGMPYWNKELGDFQARVWFKLPPGGNNGLAIRYPGKGNAAYDGMTELQVIDENYYANRTPPQPTKKLDPRQQHGSVYGMIPGIPGYQRPIGEWNFEEVTVKGSTIRVELNGTVILDADVSKVDMSTVMDKKEHPGKDRTKGFFGLAGHSDPVAFKDLSIKEL